MFYVGPVKGSGPPKQLRTRISVAKMVDKPSRGKPKKMSVSQELAEAEKKTHSKLATKVVIKSVAIKEYVSYRGKYYFLVAELTIHKVFYVYYYELLC